MKSVRQQERTKKMFTVKAFVSGYLNMRHGYEAESYTVDEVQGRVDFVRRDGHGQVLCLGKGYSQIVIENSAGKTVENLRQRPDQEVA